VFKVYKEFKDNKESKDPPEFRDNKESKDFVGKLAQPGQIRVSLDRRDRQVLEAVSLDPRDPLDLSARMAQLDRRDLRVLEEAVEVEICLFRKYLAHL
jgi:hypothetical protein